MTSGRLLVLADARGRQLAAIEVDEVVHGGDRPEVPMIPVEGQVVSEVKVPGDWEGRLHPEIFERYRLRRHGESGGELVPAERDAE
jgi:hypothetical protein